MAEVIRMPKMSDTMEEGVIASWLVKVGDEVASGDILAEVETDKATMELENYEDGKVLYIAAEAGSSIPVDGVIAIIGEDGADYQKLLDAQKAKSTSNGQQSAATKEEAPKSDAAPKQEEKKEVAKPVTSTNSSSSSEGGREKASPLLPGGRI